MKKLLSIVFIAALTGIISGYVLADMQMKEQVSGNNFCAEVENGLLEEMEEGFVNCFPPKNIDVELREGIRNKTSVECICRRKVGDKVEQINIARSGSQ